MNFENIFTPYKARKLTETDVLDILGLYLENAEYFKHCPPRPSRETVKEDMVVLPPAKKAADKYFIGIFDGDFLVAVMDLIDRYPDDRTAFIGIFMVSKSRQRKGIGTYIAKALSQTLRAEGYRRIRLGYTKTNLSAQSFWIKQGFQPTGAEFVSDVLPPLKWCTIDFQPTGAEFVRERYTVIEAEKRL